MKKKFLILSAVSFISALLIFILTYFLFHYWTPEGFSSFFHETPEKPFVTLLFGIWGVFFFFSGFINFFISVIFFSDKNKKQGSDFFERKN